MTTNGDSITVTPPLHTEVIIATIDAPLFRAFILHKEEFRVMLNAGVFDLQSGQANINKNDGVIANIHIDQMTYKRNSARM